MTAQRYTPDIIARAEQAVCKIRGISSCRISTDAEGEISEVHVVATAKKSPKLISRDVETCLMAEMAMAVDYKKIGVVLLESNDAADRDKHDATRPPQSDDTVAEFPIEEFPSRFAFQSVNLFISQESVQAEVELVRDGIETFGSAKSENLSVNHLRVVAEATLKAVVELLDENIRLCLSEVEEIVLGDDTAIVVKVDLVRNRESKSLAGCSLFSGNANQTAVFATLDAVNRVLGVLKSGSSIEYKIK
jgi:hypothetical protein